MTSIALLCCASLMASRPTGTRRRTEQFAEDEVAQPAARGQRRARNRERPRGEQRSLPPVAAIVVIPATLPAEAPESDTLAARLERTVRSLISQDYAAVSLILADQSSGLGDQVVAAGVGAHVLKVPAEATNAEATNTAAMAVTGAPFLCLVRCGVVLEPEAISKLVEEAYRSRAGIVGPKIRNYDEPDELLDVGWSIDRFAVPYSEVVPGEVDQEQHDAVRDVFFVSDAVMLVRSDLFNDLDGFDVAHELGHRDLEFCWRARLLGSRVVVQPGAVAYARPPAQASDKERPNSRTLAAAERVEIRRRMRTMLTCYSRESLWRLIPEKLLSALASAFALILTGRFRLAGAQMSAWSRVVVDARAVRGIRKPLQAKRKVADADLRYLQVRGGVRFFGYISQSFQVEDRLLAVSTTSQKLSERIALWAARPTTYLWALILMVMIVAGRSFLIDGVPSIGSMAHWPSVSDLWRTFTSQWNYAAFGAPDAPEPRTLVLAGLSLPLLANTALTQTLLVVFAMPLGAWGVARLVRPFSWQIWPSFLAAVAYMINPMPRNAIAQGQFGPLCAYVLMPWVVLAIVRIFGVARLSMPEQSARSVTPSTSGLANSAATAASPPSQEDDALHADDDGAAQDPQLDQAVEAQRRVSGVVVAEPTLLEPDRLSSRRWGVEVSGAPTWLGPVSRALPVAVLAAILFALYPPSFLLLVAVVLVWALLIPLTGMPGPTLKAVGVFMGALLLGALLLMPWSFKIWDPAGAGEEVTTGVLDLARFAVGPHGHSWMDWGLVVAALASLFIARGERLVWAMRAWAMALVGWAAVWLPGHSGLGGFPGGTTGPLVLAAVGVAWAVGLSIIAFNEDVRSAGLSWRHGAAVLALALLLFPLLSFAGMSLDGTWKMPGRTWDDALSWLPSEARKGEFRMVWLGDVETLPGTPVEGPDGLGVWITRNAQSDVTDLSARGEGPAYTDFDQYVQLALNGQTSRLGHLLSTYGIKFLAVPDGISPKATQAARQDVLRALETQTDLARIDTDEPIALYQNVAFMPVKAQLPGGPGGLMLATRPQSADSSIDIQGATSAFPLGLRPGQGGVGEPGALIWGEQYNSAWRASTATGRVSSQEIMGGMNGFQIDAGGAVTVQYETQWHRWPWLAAQVLMWAAAVVALFRLRRRRNHYLSIDAVAEVDVVDEEIPDVFTDVVTGGPDIPDAIADTGAFKALGALEATGPLRGLDLGEEVHHQRVDDLQSSGSRPQDDSSTVLPAEAVDEAFDAFEHPDEADDVQTRRVTRRQARRETAENPSGDPGEPSAGDRGRERPPADDEGDS